MAELSAEAAELIVRDYLIKSGLDKTLAALNEECREQTRATPTVEAWYEMSAAVRLPELLQAYTPQGELQQRAIVEVLMAHLRALLGTAARQAVDPSLLPPQAASQVSPSEEAEGAAGVAAVAAESTFSEVNGGSSGLQQTLPAEQLPGAGDSGAGGALDGGGLEGAASVHAISSDGSVRHVASVHAASTQKSKHVVVTHHDAAHGPRPQKERKHRPIQTASSEPPSFSFEPKEGAVRHDDASALPAGQARPSTADREAQQAGRTLIGRKGSEGPGSKKKKKKKKKKDGDDEEERHVEFHMPHELRHRMIHRTMEAMRKNEEEQARISAVVSTRSTKQKLDELASCHLAEEHGLRKKRACGLCEVKFSEVNLPVAVTVKAIYDLRHTWMLRRQAQLEQAKKDAKALAKRENVAGLDDEVSLESVKMPEEAAALKRVTQLSHNGAMLQPSRSYDQKRVCSLCAQFFDLDEVYRPSFGAKLEKLQEEKRERDLAEDNKYWDPLLNPIHTLDTTSKKARQRASDRARRRKQDADKARTKLMAASQPNSPGGQPSPGGLSQGSLSPGGQLGGPKQLSDLAGQLELADLNQGSVDGSEGAFFVAVKHRDVLPQPGGGKPAERAMVFGHYLGVGEGAKPRRAPFKLKKPPGSKSLIELEAEREAEAFRDEAAKSAFWHASATDTLATKGLHAFAKGKKDRSLAKSTVV